MATYIFYMCPFICFQLRHDSPGHLLWSAQLRAWDYDQLPRWSLLVFLTAQHLDCWWGCNQAERWIQGGGRQTLLLSLFERDQQVLMGQCCGHHGACAWGMHWCFSVQAAHQWICAEGRQVLGGTASEIDKRAVLTTRDTVGLQLETCWPPAQLNLWPGDSWKHHVRLVPRLSGAWDCQSWVRFTVACSQRGWAFNPAGKISGIIWVAQAISGLEAEQDLWETGHISGATEVLGQWAAQCIWDHQSLHRAVCLGRSSVCAPIMPDISQTVWSSRSSNYTESRRVLFMDWTPWSHQRLSG